MSISYRIELLLEPLGMAVAMLTYLAPHGALVSKPMWPLEMDGTEAAWFFTDLHSGHIEHLHAANLSFTDPARGTYVSLSGRGEIHTDYARVERLSTSFTRHWFPEAPKSTAPALLKFMPEGAEYWDAQQSRMVRLFAMASRVVVGKPIALGEYGTLTGLAKPLPRTAPRPMIPRRVGADSAPFTI